jgi:hypothetical protein
VRENGLCHEAPRRREYPKEDARKFGAQSGRSQRLAWAVIMAPSGRREIGRGQSLRLQERFDEDHGGAPREFHVGYRQEIVALQVEPTMQLSCL